MEKNYPLTHPLHDKEGNLIEEPFGWRQRIGLILAGLLLLAMWFSPPLGGLSVEGTRVALLAVMMACGMGHVAERSARFLYWYTGS